MKGFLSNSFMSKIKRVIKENMKILQVFNNPAFIMYQLLSNVEMSRDSNVFQRNEKSAFEIKAWE